MNAAVKTAVPPLPDSSGASFLLIHGRRDDTVSLRHSQIMAAAALCCGAEAELRETEDSHLDLYGGNRELIHGWIREILSDAG